MRSIHLLTAQFDYQCSLADGTEALGFLGSVRLDCGGIKLCAKEDEGLLNQRTCRRGGFVAPSEVNVKSWA